MRTVEAARLTAEAYAEFGQVLEASNAPGAGREANQGKARAFDRLIDLRNDRPDAALNVSVFRARASRDSPLEIKLLERHPRSTQLFVPMAARRYLVVVALGETAPDLSTLRAFVATGAQGASYRPGVWHHPIVALDVDTDFGCFVHEDGSSDDCTLVALAADDRLCVVVGDLLADVSARVNAEKSAQG